MYAPGVLRGRGSIRCRYRLCQVHWQAIHVHSLLTDVVAVVDVVDVVAVIHSWQHTMYRWH